MNLYAIGFTCDRVCSLNGRTDLLPQLLNEDAASHFLSERGCPGTTTTLRKWRSEGGGPRFRKVGRYVRYTPEDLIEFVERKLSPRAFANTSEAQQYARQNAAAE